jgi:hypothetical protein
MLIQTFLYSIWGAFLRRWFGGALEKYKILKNRGVQTVFMVLTFLSIYLTDYKDWRNWVYAISISCWLQFIYWSIGHGPGYDIGRGGQPSEDTIKRYKKYYLNVIPDWFAARGFFSYYDDKYDFTWMFVRYTFPMIPMAFINWHYLLIGMAIAPIYRFCWLWYESTVWLFTEEWRSKATHEAEIICGALTYGGCYLINYFS